MIGFEILSSLTFASEDKETPGSGTLSVGAHPIVKLIRPTPETIHKVQLPLVRAYADLRRDRASEINAQIREFFPFFSTVCDLNPARRRFTLELLTVLWRVVTATEMRVKHALAMPRPFEYSSQIMPMIQTPGHSSFPAGHQPRHSCSPRCSPR